MKTKIMLVLVLVVLSLLVTACNDGGDIITTGDNVREVSGDTQDAIYESLNGANERLLDAWDEFEDLTILEEYYPHYQPSP